MALDEFMCFPKNMANSLSNQEAPKSDVSAKLNDICILESIC